ncbi:glutamate carboxypeptidase [Phenylobacterium soli]|uniref:Glutamate carboxypeptidase n=2 Tax=Phenylobacterium soli TaxID=2170551 RepID=A0A328AKC9_9CAUL|nr:glutamate carboxypeptidase [Phenylobacterium soli]RAK55413.1 glutamate carboxypeptidase [Phenylobacterium soli]
MRNLTFAVAGVAALLVTGAAEAAPAKAAAAKPRDAKVWAAAQAAREGQLKLLESVVNIDSGTGDAAGGNKVAAVLIPRLKALGMSVEILPPEEAGLADNVVARLSGTGKGRILMIGHLDTVFGPGTVAKRAFRMDAERAYGPGVDDEKGGVVEGVTALEILKSLGFKDFKEIVFLIESSEERGSPGTRRLIDRLLKDADVELNLEPGDPPDAVTVWRKGSTTFHIDVKGRAAHAGVAPQDGRNAALELIHQIRADDVFPKSGEGLTANLTVITAGTRNNIIPEDAQALINVRTRTPGQVEEVQSVLEKNAQTTAIPDTKVTVSREPAFPPLPNNPATEALAARAEAIYAGLGLQLARGGNGGASESALAADAGVAALDGLGPVGGGFHSDKEYLELKTLTPRLYLLTKLLMDLGHTPPPRMK